MRILDWFRSKFASFRAQAKLSKFPKIRIFVKYVLPVLSFIVAAAGLYISYIRFMKPLLDNKKLCQHGIARAREQARQDKFEGAITTLDEVRKNCADVWIRQDDDVLRAELEAFRAVVDYDQIKRVRKKDLDAVEKKWGYVNAQFPDHAATMVLGGIIEELKYNPDKAVKQYEAAIKADPKYITAHIRLGYIYFKWKLQGSNWAIKAVTHFTEAASIAAKSSQDSDRKNVWPHIDNAAVYIVQAQTLLDDKCDKNPLSKCDKNVISEVLARLADAKPNLERATGLLPEDDNPRLHLLWGHYHSLQGVLRRRSWLGDPDDLFHAAKVSLGKAIKINPNIADARLLLGAVYEELSKNKIPSIRDEYKRYALAEYAKAVDIDKCNIIARSAYAITLFDQKMRNEAAEQCREGIMLIDDFVKDLDERLRHHDSEDLRVWLKNTSEEYKRYREVLLQIRGGSQSLRAMPVLTQQEALKCQ